MEKKQIAQLRRTVRTYYKKHGRHNLPWRATNDPYRILVSEVMLQQTQVARVLEKYSEFLSKFPSVQELAAAPLRDVLVVWQGLGYNRRAKMLHQAAARVVEQYDGVLPKTFEELLTLPGVGPYTAGAVCVFAYNIPVPLVETNVRTVLFFHVLQNRKQVPDTEIMSLSEELLDTKNPRDWYLAMMDYGAHLKRLGVRSNVQSKHYAKQSKFEGSDRQVRGAILRELTQQVTATEKTLVKKTKAAPARVRTQLAKLKKEGLATREGQYWKL